MLLPRLYPIVDQDLLDRRAIPVLDAARAMLEAGVQILQWRVKGHITRQMLDEAEKMAEACRQAGAVFVVNDRADVARLLDAGLHLGQDDLPAAAGRQIVGGAALLGLSTHNGAQLLAARGAPVDYLALGPVFSTGTKANPDPVLGVAQFAAWRALTERPLVAIGGIDRLRAREVFRAGADSVAVIGDLIPDAGGAAEIGQRTVEWLKIVKP